MRTWGWGVLVAACLPFAAMAQAPDGDKVTASAYSSQITIRFPEPMQILENRQSAALVRMTPKPETCAWEDDTELACTFEDELPEATRFRIDLPAGLRTTGGRDLGPLTLHAETARPTLHVRIDAWKHGLPQIKAYASLPTTAASVAAALRLTLDGKPARVSVRKLDGNHYAIDLPPIARETRLELALAPGLRSTKGPLAGTQSGRQLLAIAGEPFQVRGLACAGIETPLVAVVREGRAALDGCAPGETMRVLVSRPLDQAARNAWTAHPPAGVRFAGGGREVMNGGTGRDGTPVRAPGTWIDFVVDAPKATTTFEVPDLREFDGDDRLAPVAVRVTTVSPRATLVAPFQKVLLAEPDVARLQVVSTAPQSVGMVGIGRDVQAGPVATPMAGDASVDALPASVMRVLEEGGAVQVDPAGVARGGRAFIAAPDFDLFALAGPNDVLVWANAWDGGAPIAGAQVELLAATQPMQAPRVLATGVTAADGTALLALPTDFVVPAGPNARVAWSVRAQAGKRRGATRAVLPFHENYYGGTLTNATRLRAWGVTDRPIYRAGDTVQWRMWLRDVRGGRLSASASRAPVNMVLRDDWNRVIARWESTPDASGALQGATAIPVHAPDMDYCVGLDDGDEDRSDDEGSVCFFVGTYRAQDLWMRASSTQRLVRPGDALAFDVEAGYYSGGSAAGVAFDKVQAAMHPATLDALYPAWKGYAFAYSERQWSRWPVKGASDLRLVADAGGRAHVSLPVAFEEQPEAPLPPFGEVTVTSEVKLSDRESTTSNPVSMYFARFDRYVGLKVEPAWLDATTPVKVHAVVVGADGQEHRGEAVEIDVVFAPWASDSAGMDVHHCTVRASEEAACDFPRKRSGRYIVKARSGDAAPAEVTRYVWVSGDDTPRDAHPTIEVQGEAGPAGAPLRVVLKQPASQGRVLLLVRHGGTMLGHRAFDITAPTQVFELATDAHWPRNVSVTAYIREVQTLSGLPAGYRQPVGATQVSTEVEFAAQVRTRPPVAVSFAQPRAQPAQTLQLALRNDSGATRNVTLAIVDDALRALGAEYLAAMDPATASRWGSGYQWRTPADFGFAGWNTGGPWRWAFGRKAAGKDGIEVVERGGINPIDVASVESTTILTAEQFARIPVARDTTTVALMAPGTVRARNDTGAGLDSVTVMGAGALEDVVVLGGNDEEPPVVFDDPSPVDAPGQSASSKPGVKPRPSPSHVAASDALALARVRTKFADTALWRTDIVLAPGETRTIDFGVPDNLTRWRAVAWSDEGGDDIAMADATLEAGLPVEARLQAPVRVYPGDRTRVAVNVRHVADAATQAVASLRVQEGKAEATHDATLSLVAAGQDSFGVALSPQTPGTWLLTAAAATDAGRDAIAAPLEVASPTIAASRTQAGWIGDAPIALDLPTLPASATDKHLQVSVWRGNTALLHGWTTDLREYPHRCWEQILSRAVGAALALERNDPAWPDAQAVVQEALANAPIFQDDDGDMRYFAAASEAMSPIYDRHHDRNVALTAYTLDAFALLRSLGHAVPVDVQVAARNFLAEEDMHGDDGQGEERALAASVVARPAEERDGLWREWPKLSLPGRIAAARALARDARPDAKDAFDALFAATQPRGPARVVERPQDSWLRWMGSRMREQCGLVRLFGDFPQFAPAGAHAALQAGLSDLYAGGVDKVDTQSAATCLIALRDPSGASQAPVAVDATVGATTQRIALAAGEQRAAADFEAVPATGRVEIAASQRPDTPLAYLTRITYEEDARQAQSNAVGFTIERRYAVLRAHKWTPVADTTLREGDWVRITLVVSNTRPRHFVAVTDDLPGGLRPTDLALAGVAGVDVQALGNEGDWAFYERKLDARKPKFYADVLWPGRHDIHYFARVGNTGDYLAAPAVAELMYGETTRARTAAQHLRIADPAPGAARVH